MSPHRTKWLWCTLVVLAGPTCSPVRSSTVRTPPKTPANIEAQAKFFQYRHLPTSEDFHQGHRLGSEKHFTERHEKSRPSEGLFSAKIRWGDKKGGYGEHYWDLNHAGHADKHGHDDDYNPGSDNGYHVHENDRDDSYDEPSEQTPNYDNDQSNNYDTDNYDPEKASYEEANRAKRHPKTRIDDNEEDYEEVKRIKPRQRKPKSEIAANRELDSDETSPVIVEDVKENEKPRREEIKKNPRKHRPVLKELNFEDDDSVNTYTGTDQVENATSEKQKQYTPQPETEQTSYVPYEAGAGVRQYRPPDVTPAASVPRLFLEPSTGRVVDRATGQAYILQPIVNNYRNNFY